MKRLRMTILAILAAIVVGAGLAVLFHQPARLPAIGSDDKAPLDADGKPRMRGLTYTHVEEGKSKWSLKADGARYQEDTGEVFLKAVRVIFYQEKGGPIAITGDEGVYNQKTQTVTIRGNVDGKTADGNRLVTEYIVYREKDKVAETDAPVTVEGTQYKVKGIGMRVLVDQNKVFLKRNVHSTFIPQGKGPPPGATKD